MGNEKVKENNIKSNSDNNSDNFFIRNIHLVLAIIFGLCALSMYVYYY